MNNRVLRPLFGIGIGVGALLFMGSNLALGEAGAALALGAAAGLVFGLRPEGDDRQA